MTQQAIISELLTIQANALETANRAQALLAKIEKKKKPVELSRAQLSYQRTKARRLNKNQTL
jgi:hypothetical protein